MDFMNLNQAAHGDREFGFIAARLRLERKVVVGHWGDAASRREIGTWTRAACAKATGGRGRIARFGDNMREVAVTEGDKVEAQRRLGFSVNTWGVGDLVAVVDEASDADVDALVGRYLDEYDVAAELRPGGDRASSLRDGARIELGLRRFLEDGGFTAFTDTFEDLHGLKQLPGLAVQRLMADGYGFGGEGDWKTAAMVRAMKVMSAGLEGGISFMEDYTYHLTGERRPDPRRPHARGLPVDRRRPAPPRGASAVHRRQGGPGPARVRRPPGSGGRRLHHRHGAALPHGRDRRRRRAGRAAPPEAPGRPRRLASATRPPDERRGLDPRGRVPSHQPRLQRDAAEHLRDFAAMCGVELLVIDEDDDPRRVPGPAAAGTTSTGTWQRAFEEGRSCTCPASDLRYRFEA